MPDPTPHGTSRGWYAGCQDPATCPATPTCTRRHLDVVQHKRARAARLAGRSFLVPAGPVIRHVDRLLAADRLLTRQYIARAARVSPNVFVQVRDSGDRARLSRPVAARLLAVTLDDARSFLPKVPLDKARLVVGQMQALGYPASWQGRQIGQDHFTTRVSNWSGARAHQQGVPATLYRDLVALRDSLAGRPATVEDGLRGVDIDRARSAAAAAGFYPPAAYDDNGNLNLRFLPGHPWAQLDERCAERLDLLRAIVTGATDQDAGDLAGMAARSVTRLRASMHLLHADPRRPEVVARITAALERYDDGDLDPVQAVLDLGALDVRHMARLTRDHPVLVAWQAKHGTVGRVTGASAKVLAA